MHQLLDDEPRVRASSLGGGNRFVCSLGLDVHTGYARGERAGAAAGESVASLLRKEKEKLWVRIGELTTQIVRTSEHQTRVHRAKAGLPEVPLDETPRLDPADPPPDKLLRLCNLFKNSRKQMLDAAKLARSNGASWDTIIGQYAREISEQSPRAAGVVASILEEEGAGDDASTVPKG